MHRLRALDPARLAWAPFGLALVAWLGFSVWLAAGAPEDSYDLANLWLYNAVIVLAGATCLVRAAAPGPLRWAWIALGAGLLSWAAADVYWVVALQDLQRTPYPSWADAGYLATLPFFYVGIAVLLRHRVGKLNADSWLDGAIGTLAAAALATAILAPALVGVTRGDAAAVITNLAYPLGDVLLVAFLMGGLLVSGFTGARALVLIAAGLLVWGVADSIYLYQEATSAYEEGWLDHGWLLGSMLVASAALIPERHQPRRRTVYRSPAVFPSLFAAIAVATLVWDHFEEVPGLSVALAAITLAAVLLRLTASFRDNARLLTALHADSVTDPLTGMSNRRSLFDDLEAVLARPDRPVRVFAIFDLDGFKAYNDTFGHPAGDALLRRLGHGLEDAVRGYGTAYRLGGDEFCVLADPGVNRPASIAAAARAALTAVGDGFTITASGGLVLVPEEADSPSEVLRLADNRMYAEKGSRPGRVDRQTRDLLMRIMQDREPGLNAHQDRVVCLARAVARGLALDAEQTDIVIRAAEFHDIGKIGVPDEVLKKAGPLDQSEWELMRKHTLIGERILGASPAMGPVGRVVRSSHERWDGAGYPDGLAGDEIPLAARIIFVCDAFDAMRSERPYCPALDRAGAIAELRAGAGSQFDPEIVEVFCRVVERDGEEGEGLPADAGRAAQAARRNSSSSRSRTTTAGVTDTRSASDTDSSTNP
jgi:two-component system, cell cycle response regulator